MKLELYLKEIDKAHLPLLFMWRNEPSFLSNCSPRGKIKNKKELDKELKADFKKDKQFQFIIYYKNQPIGTIYSYSYNSSDKYLFITTYITEEYSKKSLGIRSFVILSEFLFDKFDLFKIYIDVYSYNKEMLSVLEKCNFLKEGVFNKQHLFQQERYDVLRYGIYHNDILFWKNKLKTTTANISYRQ